MSEANYKKVKTAEASVAEQAAPAASCAPLDAWQCDKCDRTLVPCEENGNDLQMCAVVFKSIRISSVCRFTPVLA